MPLSLLFNVFLLVLLLFLCASRSTPTPDETLIPVEAHLNPAEHALSSALFSEDSQIIDELTQGCGAAE